jgi:hypothetical protein
VREGERGPARQACRALRDAACQAARRLRVACLPAGADGPALWRHAAAVARAVRQRPGLEELVLDDHPDGGSGKGRAGPYPPGEGWQHALAYLGALGRGAGGVEGGPGQQAGATQPACVCPAVKLALRVSWPFSRAGVDALAVALRPGGALSNVRTLELRWEGANEPEAFGHLQRTLPPGLRVFATLECSSHSHMGLSVARWAQAEMGGPSGPGQQPGANEAAGPVAPLPLTAEGKVRALLAEVEAQQALQCGGGELGGQGAAGARLVGLTLLGWSLDLRPDLARAAALLPSLEALAANGVAMDAGLQEFEWVMQHLARCPALRELRLTSQRRLQRPWAWSAQALLWPRVQCEVACDAQGSFSLGWPALGEGSAAHVQASMQGMAGCGRPPATIFLFGGCTVGTPGACMQARCGLPAP